MHSQVLYTCVCDVRATCVRVWCGMCVWRVCGTYFVVCIRSTVGLLRGGSERPGTHGVEPLAQSLVGAVGVLARRRDDDAHRLLVHALTHQHLEPHLQPGGTRVHETIGG